MFLRSLKLCWLYTIPCGIIFGIFITYLAVVLPRESDRNFDGKGSSPVFDRLTAKTVQEILVSQSGTAWRLLDLRASGVSRTEENIHNTQLRTLYFVGSVDDQSQSRFVKNFETTLYIMLREANANVTHDSHVQLLPSNLLRRQRFFKYQERFFKYQVGLLESYQGILRVISHGSGDELTIIIFMIE